MAFSNADVESQVQDISRIVKMIPGCLVVPHRTTNKRMVVACTGRNVARALLAQLTHDEYPIHQAAAGLLTDTHYVEVRFNYPY